MLWVYNFIPGDNPRPEGPTTIKILTREVLRSGFPPITDRALVHDCVAHDMRESIPLLDMAATPANHGDKFTLVIKTWT